MKAVTTRQRRANLLRILAVEHEERAQAAERSVVLFAADPSTDTKDEVKAHKAAARLLRSEARRLER